jgi:hypothetical protein
MTAEHFYSTQFRADQGRHYKWGNANKSSQGQPPLDLPQTFAATIFGHEGRNHSQLFGFIVTVQTVVKYG